MLNIVIVPCGLSASLNFFSHKFVPRVLKFIFPKYLQSNKETNNLKSKEIQEFRECPGEP